MAKEEVPAFDPWKRESYSESTGLIDDVDVSILSLKYGQTDYQGKQPLTTALLMSFKDEEGKVYNEIYSIGAAGNKRFKPSKDGENLVNKDGSPAGGTLNLKSKAAMLVGSFLDAGASFRKTSGGGQPATDDPSKVKVHVGKHKGIELRELTEESITSLIEHWLPKARAEVKQTADDKRLINGLTWYQTKFKADEEAQVKLEEDDLPY